MPTDPRSEALLALCRFLFTDASLRESLQRVADLAGRATEGADLAGITMLDEHARVTTSVFTDPETLPIDAAQYTTGRGPCLQAWHTGTVVRIDDIDEAVAVYPEFVAAARHHGIHATLSLPLVVHERSIGALSLYSRGSTPFSSAAEASAAELAETASFVLANASAYWGAIDLNENLTQAMRSRATIEQAKGMLMAQDAIGPDEAFARLAHASQRENVKLRDIAERMVQRAMHRPDVDAPPMAG